MEPRRVLIVANQTAGGQALRDEMKRRVAEGAHEFTLVVPATPPQDHLTYNEGEADDIARGHLEAALERLRRMGMDIDGHVGDASPVQAIADALLVDEYDEIVLSTLPSGASRWLKQGLPERIERRFGLPLTVVIGDPHAAFV